MKFIDDGSSEIGRHKGLKILNNQNIWECQFNKKNKGHQNLVKLELNH